MKRSFLCPVCHQNVTLEELPPQRTGGERGPIVCPACSTRLVMKKESPPDVQIIVAMMLITILGPLLRKHVPSIDGILLTILLAMVAFELYRKFVPKYRLEPDLGPQSTAKEIPRG